MKTARARALTARTTGAALLLAVTGCSTMGGSGDSATEPSPSGTSEGSSDSTDGEVGGTVVLVTHSSFALPKKLVRSFESETGIDLETRSAGDGGTLTARLSLTKDNPTGDVAFGVDNTFASRPLDEGVFATYAADLPAGADEYVLDEGGDRLTPVDVGNVCVNVDTTWFEREGIEPPQTLDDLVDPAYEDLFVTSGASTSSPGMAFLLSTIAEYGEDGWQDYWTDLLANGAKVVDGWEDAYYGDFTQGGGEGERPIVLSYDSSPAFTVAGRPLDHGRAARHLLPPGGVRRGARGCGQPGRRRGGRRLAGLRRGAGRAADEHVRLPGERRRRGARRLGGARRAAHRALRGGARRHRREP